MEKEKTNGLSPLELFLFFFKIGWFTFGGGWSIIAQMEEEFINKKDIMTKEELLDMYSVAKSLPGIMVTNLAVIFGYRNSKVLGAIASIIGISLPPVIILSIVTLIYNSIKDNVYVSYALRGIRTAVVPIILTTVLSMWKPAIKDNYCLIFCILAFVLTTFFDIGNIKVILGGIVIACILTLGGKIHGTN